MKSFATAVIMSVAAHAKWSEIQVSYNYSDQTKYIESQEWSTIETGQDNCITLENNNSVSLKDMKHEDVIFTPMLRGGHMEYTVDLSKVDCGCVAGVYAHVVSPDCSADDPSSGKPQCPSIDIMQANPHGFNTAAHPCANGDCSAKSQCEYNMNKEGKAKYGDHAYGPNGDKIDTNRAFKVKTEFVTTKNYADLWMLRTTLSQDASQMVMDANCEGYLDAFDWDLSVGMALVFSSWDNRDGTDADFECKGSCPAPAQTCDNASVAFSDLTFMAFGSQEDPVEEGSESEASEESEESEEEKEEEEASEESEDDDSLEFKTFTANIDEFGDVELYLKGLEGALLETKDDCITMGIENTAFIRDVTAYDTVDAAYWHAYQGGSVAFDVDVSDVGCGCAAGVYLTALDQETCSWGARADDAMPTCQSIDLMEANAKGFMTASHPMGNAGDSHCTQKAEDYDYWAYGPNSMYTIDTSKSFTVQTRFFSALDEDSWFYQGLKQIETVLSQGDKEVSLVQDCEFTTTLGESLNGWMAMGISVYDTGLDNEISPQCTETCDSSSKAVIKNIRFGTDDSVVEEQGEMVIGDTTASLAECEAGCAECRNYSYTGSSETGATCVDHREMKFAGLCPSKGKWSDDKCSSEGAFCAKSYPFGDPLRMKSEDAACRTMPAELIDGPFEWSSKPCRNQNWGLCALGCSTDETCTNSWPLEDPLRWKSAGAMCRCMKP